MNSALFVLIVYFPGTPLETEFSVNPKRRMTRGSRTEKRVEERRGCENFIERALNV